MIDRIRWGSAIAAGFALSAAAAFGQAPGQTSAGNPTVATQRAGTDLQDQSGRTQGSTLRQTGLSDPTKPPETDATAPAPGLEAAKADPSDQIKIRVNKIEVQGLTGLNAPHVEKLKHPYEGRDVTLGELRLLTIKMGKALRQRGYFLARVVLPAQDVTNGVVKLVVSEGRWGGVTVVGNRHYTTKFIERFFRPAMRDGVIRARPLEAALLTLNEFSDLRVRSTFQAGKKPGESDVVLTVQDAKPFHVGFDYNNYGNRLVGRNRAGVTVWGGSAFTEGDELTVHVVEPFPGKSEPIYQAGYSVPVGDHGTRIIAGATKAKTRVSGVLAPLDIRGDAEIFSLLVNRPVERLVHRANNFQLGFQVKTIQNFVLRDTLVSQDDLRELTLGYNGYNIYRDFQFVHGTVITQGLGTAFGGTPNGDRLSSRVFGGNAFTKLNSDVVWTWKQGHKGQLVARGSVQVSTRPLPTAEMFGVGGPDTVRGFIQSEFLCDDGYLASVEYRYSILEGLHKRLRAQGALFLDHGGGSLHHPLPGQDSSSDLTGMGIGFRAAIGSATTLRLDLGVPVSVDQNVQGDHEVLYAQLATRYERVAASTSPAPVRRASRGHSTLPHVAICFTVGALLLFAANAEVLIERIEHVLTGRHALAGTKLVRQVAHSASRVMMAVEAQSYDRRLDLRTSLNRGPVDERLLIVDIDDRSLARYGRWPWSRTLQARLISGLHAHGARGMLLDIEYPEPTDGQPEADDALAKAFRGGPTFGMMFTAEAPISRMPEQRRQQEGKILEWVMTGRMNASGDLPKETRALWADEPELVAREADVIAVARHLFRKPAADVLSLVTDGVLPDMPPPPMIPDMPFTHPVLLLPPALAIVNQGAGETEAVLVERLAKATDPRATRDSDRGARFFTHLANVIKLLRAKRERLAAAGDLLLRVQQELLDREVFAELEKNPGAKVTDAVEAVTKRLHLPAKGLATKVSRLLERRRALSQVRTRDLIQVTGRPLDLQHRGELTPPIATLASAYTGVGLSIVERDPDGTLRRQPLFYDLETTFPGGHTGAGDAPGKRSVALQSTLKPAALLLDLDLTRTLVENDAIVIPGRSGQGGVAIPIDGRGQAMLDLRGRWLRDGFAHVNAVQVLEVVELEEQREAVLREQEDYLRLAAVPDSLERFATLPVGPCTAGPIGALVPQRVTTGRQVVLDALREQLAQFRMTKLLHIGNEVKAYVQAMDDALAAKDQQTFEEAQAEFEKVRPFYQEFLVRLPVVAEALNRQVKGRFCFIGSTATGTTDISVVPLEHRYINLGVHVNMLNQILTGGQLRRSNWWKLDLPILIVYLLLMPIVLPAVSIRGGALLAIAMIAGHAILASVMMIYYSLVMEVGVPVLALASSYVLITLRRYLLEERQKQQIREMFETYLDPKVVELMVGDESLWRELGGTVRDITPFFSDLAGFASISELLSPEELSTMLVDYLTPMTDILLRHGGIRERYVGDAIVAFFGAPVVFPDHAVKGCLTAIEQVEMLERLRREWWSARVGWYVKIRERGYDLEFRIGLATGAAKVGNFGSRHVKNYSMNGDIVNLAARLEGVNKLYGTQALCSEPTALAAAEAIEFREVDLLKVVGKTLPVRIFEIVGRKGSLSPALVELHGRFAAALAAYRARRFDEARTMFAAIKQAYPSDGPTQTYLKRLEDAGYLATLGGDWDGSYAAASK